LPARFSALFTPATTAARTGSGATMALAFMTSIASDQTSSTAKRAFTPGLSPRICSSARTWGSTGPSWRRCATYRRLRSGLFPRRPTSRIPNLSPSIRAMKKPFSHASSRARF
jgi:hypothetical protein